MRKSILSLLLFVFSFSVTVWAQGLALSDTYRIGDEWGKYPYVSSLEDNTLARFTELKKSFKISYFFGNWSDIDLALFAIDIESAADAQLMSAVASPFDFQAPLYRSQPLVTIGYGLGNNPSRSLVVNQDDDCVVFSGAAEFRFMADPDDLNPAPYKSWSFANGCDVSHGDSGSAMMDRNTGAVVGVIWTGRIPKNSKVQNSSYLRELLQSPNEDIWTELSYAVPAFKIGEYFYQLISTTNLPYETRKVLEEML